MYISKSRFINWTRCPMYFAMELKHNPSGMPDIDDERERLAEKLTELKEELSSGEGSEDEEESFDAQPSPELESLLPYYNQVEEEALKVAMKYFTGAFIADSRDVHKQKLFEYELRGNTYRCYVDIYNDNEKEINIIEVKATTNRRFTVSIDKDSGDTLFARYGNVWNLNKAAAATSDKIEKKFNANKAKLLNRYTDEGKYPHDLAFQKFVIEHALRKAGDNRPVNYYLAVLNNQYVFDGTVDASGHCVYKQINGQEIVTFYNMNEISEEYQPIILKEVGTLESYISKPNATSSKVLVGPHCAWGKNTECIYWSHCFQKLRLVPDTNKANNYLNFRGFKAGDIKDKYQLVNEGYCKFDDVPSGWLEKENHKIQRDCYDNGDEYVDEGKMHYWFDQIEYPIYHFDFETFPCPLPRFNGEKPYRQSVFEFSLHIERAPGVCDKIKDNFIFLNHNCGTDERLALANAIVSHFQFNPDGTLRGTMLAQNTNFEKDRLEELAELFPDELFPGLAKKLMAIRVKSMDLIHLLKTNKDLYSAVFGEDRAATINYYHKDLSGSYSIKKTLPVLVPSLTYKGMDVGNGSQAYIAYINYDSPIPTIFGGKPMYTKADRRQALESYCQQDTWAMVEILRAVRAKI